MRREEERISSRMKVKSLVSNRERNICIVAEGPALIDLSLNL